MFNFDYRAIVEKFGKGFFFSDADMLWYAYNGGGECTAVYYFGKYDLTGKMKQTSVDNDYQKCVERNDDMYHYNPVRDEVHPQAFWLYPTEKPEQRPEDPYTSIIKDWSYTITIGNIEHNLSASKISVEGATQLIKSLHP